MSSSSRILTSFADLPPRFGVFGGTFDPVQNAHVAIAGIAHTHGVPIVVCIPNKKNPLKNFDVEASDEDRVEMLSRAFENSSHVVISRIELDGPGKNPSFTVDTLRTIRKSRSDLPEVTFIGGSDLLPSLSQWKEPHELFSLVDRCVIVERFDGDRNHLPLLRDAVGERGVRLIEEGYISGIILPESSTDVRRSVKAGGDLASLVPPGVAEYIRERGLYRL